MNPLPPLVTVPIDIHDEIINHVQNGDVDKAVAAFNKVDNPTTKRNMLDSLPGDAGLEHADTIRKIRGIVLGAGAGGRKSRKRVKNVRKFRKGKSTRRRR